MNTREYNSNEPRPSRIHKHSLRRGVEPICPSHARVAPTHGSLLAMRRWTIGLLPTDGIFSEVPKSGKKSNWFLPGFVGLRKVLVEFRHGDLMQYRLIAVTDLRSRKLAVLGRQDTSSSRLRGVDSSFQSKEKSVLY